MDATHIIVGNDNNLPFSSSRAPNRADDNEFILLEVGDFLKQSGDRYQKTAVFCVDEEPADRMAVPQRWYS